MEMQLRIEGMTCASCVSRVENALLSVPGVESAAVNFATEKALVRAPESVSLSSLIQAVQGAGYRASAPTRWR